MIDALASWPHYLCHVAPIFAALPDEIRGTFYAADESLALLAKSYGIDATVGYPYRPGGPVIVAGHNDMVQCHLERPLIYVEHGAGQNYVGIDSPSYSGGGMRERVALFLTLNETTAQRERERYPETPVVVIGSPRVDDLTKAAYDGRGVTSSGALPVVAFCFHANIRICPETRATYPYWWPAVKEVTRWFTVLGHGHPREWRKLRGWYEKAGIEAVEDFTDVIRRADLVIVDNSSTGPEAAACGLPVLWLDHPTYRRDVEHGGRFWIWPQGQVSCDDPERLGQRIALALADTQGTRNARQLMADEIYPPWARGQAAQLGAAAIAARFA